MNKTYEAPQAQFISLAATETMATSAEYYDDDIGLGQIVINQILAAQFPAVLSAFHSLDESLLAAGNQTHDNFGSNAEGGRTFNSIQHAQTAAGTSTHVDDTAAVFNGLDGPGNTLGDVGQSGGDGSGDFSVFLVHDGDHFQGAHNIQIHGVLVTGFGRHVFQIQAHR